MKKEIIKIFTVLLFLLGGLLSSYSVVSAKQKAEADGHLVWDSVDQVYFCVGTPINCRFSH